MSNDIFHVKEKKTKSLSKKHASFPFCTFGYVILDAIKKSPVPFSISALMIPPPRVRWLSAAPTTASYWLSDAVTN